MTMLDEKFHQFLGSLEVTLIVIGLALLLESRRRFARTILFNTIYAVAMTVLAVAVQPIADAEGAFFASRFGVAPIRLPDQGWAVFGSGMILMLTSDLIFYWVHRAQHRYAVLWAMHSFHHSDDDLNATAAYRHYWLDKPFWALIGYLPLGLFFHIAPSVAAVYGLIFTFFAIFPHMNVRLELGPLTRIFTGPQVHRIHHSVYRDHYNTNFAGAFPVWDLLFGTYHAPKRGEFPPTGVPTLPGRPGPLEVVLWPLLRLGRLSALSSGTLSEHPGGQRPTDSVALGTQATGEGSPSSA
jgi:sterol desaturase/sphingolipid hydroxylase (fatty acid hydroxylase superfamily)